MLNAETNEIDEEDKYTVRIIYEYDFLPHDFIRCGIPYNWSWIDGATSIVMFVFVHSNVALYTKQTAVTVPTLCKIKRNYTKCICA